MFNNLQLSVCVCVCVNRGRGRLSAGVELGACRRSRALQSVMSSEPQLNSALFCMIAHDNCVLIGSAGDGV